MYLQLPDPVDVGHLFDTEELTAPGREEMFLQVLETTNVLIPNRPMKISEWAESGALRLPKDTSTRSGKLKLVEYQKDMVDAQQEPGANVVVIMGVPRIMKTTTLLVGSAYYTAYEGDDVIFYEKSEKALQVFNDSVWVPTRDVSPAFDDLVRSGRRGGGTEDKWYDQQLANGAFYRQRSAEVGGSFRQIRGRRVYLSEVGDPIWMPGKEGDKVEAALKRTQNYPDGCGMMESSPTEEETCTVTAWWKISDQRKFHVPCPHCDLYQELVPKVGDKDGAGLKYSVDAETGWVDDVWYECCDCGQRIEETAKESMIKQGVWEKTPNKNAVPGVIGFHLWAIHSFDKRSSWTEIAKAHLAQIHDPSKRQTFKNLWLGLPWQKQDMGAISLDVLAARAEPYPAVVPDQVVLLTVGGDGQQGTDKDAEAGGKPPRHEIQVVGWGYGEESWIIDHIVLEDHDAYTDSANAQIVELLQRDWAKRDGTKLRIAGGCLDVNYRMNEGLNFLASPEVRRISTLANGTNLWGVVGKGEARGSRTKLATFTRTAKHKAGKYLQLGTQSGKDTLERRKKLTGSGPEVIHWPASMLKTKGTIYDFFKSLTAIVQRKILGTPKTWWDDKPGNEVVDCWVYAYAALQLLKEKYPSIRTALSKPPAEMPLPYEGPDMSHRSDANEAGVLVIDDRGGKAKLIDKPTFAESVSAGMADDVQQAAERPKKGGLQRKSGGLQVGPSGKLRFGSGRVKSRSF